MSKYTESRYGESGKQWEHQKVVRRQKNRHKRMMKLKSRRKQISRSAVQKREEVAE